MIYNENGQNLNYRLMRFDFEIQKISTSIIYSVNKSEVWVDSSFQVSSEILRYNHLTLSQRQLMLFETVI